MKSLSRRFENIKMKNPWWSSYTCFTVAVMERNFSRAIMAKWFNVLVEKEDYTRADRNQIVEHLCLLTKRAEDADLKR